MNFNVSSFLQAGDRTAILDEIKVELKDMKLSKVHIEKCETSRPGHEAALAGGVEMGKRTFPVILRFSYYSV